MKEKFLIEQFGKINFRRDDFLWRYLDLHKFLYFAFHNNLHFSRLDSFEDPLEGITQKELLDYQNEDLISDYGQSISFENQLYERYPKSQIENSDEEVKCRQKLYFINTWFLSNRESVAMWNLYADSSGVALKIKPKKFIDFISNSTSFEVRKDRVEKLIYGRVIYKNYFDINEVEKKSFKRKYSAFRKDLSWQHEREFRLVIKTKRELTTLKGKPLEIGIPKTGIDLKIINPAQLPIVVVFHPKIQKWIEMNYRDIVFQSRYKDHIEFSNSELMLN